MEDISFKINYCESHNIDSSTCSREDNLNLNKTKKSNYFEIFGRYNVVYNKTYLVKFILYSISEDCNITVKAIIKGITYDLTINEAFTLNNMEKDYPYNFMIETIKNVTVNSIITGYIEDDISFSELRLIYYPVGDNISDEGAIEIKQKNIKMNKKGNEITVITSTSLKNIKPIIRYASLFVRSNNDIKNMKIVLNITEGNSDEEKSDEEKSDEDKTDSNKPSSSSSIGIIFLVIFILCIIFIVVVIFFIIIH